MNQDRRDAEKDGGKEKAKSHPSYGILSMSRSSIGGDGTALFGSSIQHNNTIRLSISKGLLERKGNEDRYYPKLLQKDKYIEVEMSYSQFAEAITSLNRGEGIPVTIRSVNGQWLEPCPFEDKQKKIREDFADVAKQVTRDLNSKAKEVSELLENKKTLSKADRDFIVSALRSASFSLSQKMPFISEQFEEQMDRTLMEAKAEFESFIQSKMNRLALSALAEKQDAPLPDRGKDMLPGQVETHEMRDGTTMEADTEAWIGTKMKAGSEARAGTETEDQEEISDCGMQMGI